MSHRLMQQTTEELIKLVILLHEVKVKSSGMAFQTGTGLIGLEATSTSIDEILIELSHRLQQQWTLERLQRAMRRLNLPSFLGNVGSASPHDLCRWILTNPPRLFARQNALYFSDGKQAYIMNDRGEIEIRK